VPAAKFGADAALKVIDGPYTFFLANAVVLTVPFWPLRGPWARRLTVLGAVLLVFVLLLNRRTVWLALLAGVAVLMLRKRRLGPRAAMLVATAALVTVALYVAFPEAGAPGTEPVAQSATGTGTLEWRIQGWSVLYASWSTDPVHWLVGQPFGSGFTRMVLGSEEVAEPHNFYFSTLLRMGLLGVLALIALTGGLLRALWHNPTRGDGLLGPSLFPALLTMQVIWCITWVPGLEQGIITGLAVGLAAGGVRGGHLAFPHAGRWRTREAPAGARPSRSPARGAAYPAGTSRSAEERR
jgi:O-antigen ligase